MKSPRAFHSIIIFFKKVTLGKKEIAFYSTYSHTGKTFSEKKKENVKVLGRDVFFLT